MKDIREKYTFEMLALGWLMRSIPTQAGKAVYARRWSELWHLRKAWLFAGNFAFNGNNHGAQSVSTDNGSSWAAKQAAIHRANLIPLAEAWISEF